MRNAALNASAASDCKPKKYRERADAQQPTIRLPKIPSATAAAGLRTRPSPRRAIAAIPPCGASLTIPSR
jgi:hypothetical protein